MEDRLKSKNLKTVVDVHVQTDSETQVTTCCQTEEKEGIDFEVQTDIQPDKNTMSTQTLKQENQEIAMPNRPSSNSSKPPKKRKLSCPSSNPSENSRDDPSSMESETEDFQLKIGAIGDYQSDSKNHEHESKIQIKTKNCYVPLERSEFIFHYSIL